MYFRRDVLAFAIRVLGWSELESFFHSHFKFQPAFLQFGHFFFKGCMQGVQLDDFITVRIGIGSWISQLAVDFGQFCLSF